MANHRWGEYFQTYNQQNAPIQNVQTSPINQQETFWKKNPMKNWSRDLNCKA